MDFEALLKLITENPITAGAIGTAVAAVVAFFKPVMRAAQRALVRRIEQAWPEDGGDEERVRKTVDRVNSQTLMPRTFVESAVRKHKSIPPPKG